MNMETNEPFVKNTQKRIVGHTYAMQLASQSQVGFICYTLAFSESDRTRVDASTKMYMTSRDGASEMTWFKSNHLKKERQ